MVENVNGETQVIEEMVMTETEKNTEQVEKVEGVEEVMSVDRDQLSNRRIVNSEGKNSEEMVENEEEGESDDDMSDVLYQMCQIYLRWDVTSFTLWRK